MNEAEYVAKYHEDKLVRKAAVARLISESYAPTEHGVVLRSMSNTYLLRFAKDGGFPEDVRMIFWKTAVKHSVEGGVYKTGSDKTIEDIIADKDAPESIRELARENLDAAARKRIEKLLEEGVGLRDGPPLYSKFIAIYKDENLSSEVREEAKEAVKETALKLIEISKAGAYWKLIEIKNDSELEDIHPEITKSAGEMANKVAEKIIKKIEGQEKGEQIHILFEIIKSEVSESVKEKTRKAIKTVSRRTVEHIYKLPYGRRLEYLAGISREPEVPADVREMATMEFTRMFVQDARSGSDNRSYEIYEILRELATDEKESQMMRDCAGIATASVLEKRGDVDSLTEMVEDSMEIAERNENGTLTYTPVKFTQPAKEAALGNMDLAAHNVLYEVEREPEPHHCRYITEKNREEKKRRDCLDLEPVINSKYVSEYIKEIAEELMKDRVSDFARELDKDVKELRREHGKKVRATFGKKKSLPAPKRRSRLNPGIRRRLSVG